MNIIIEVTEGKEHCALKPNTQTMSPYRQVFVPSMTNPFGFPIPVESSYMFRANAITDHYNGDYEFLVRAHAENVEKFKNLFERLALFSCLDNETPFTINGERLAVDTKHRQRYTDHITVPVKPYLLIEDTIYQSVMYRDPDLTHSFGLTLYPDELSNRASQSLELVTMLSHLHLLPWRSKLVSFETVMGMDTQRNFDDAIATINRIINKYKTYQWDGMAVGQRIFMPAEDSYNLYDISIHAFNPIVVSDESLDDVLSIIDSGHALGCGTVKTVHPFLSAYLTIRRNLHRMLGIPFIGTHEAAQGIFID